MKQEGLHNKQMGSSHSVKNSNMRGEENTRRKEKLSQLSPLNFQLLNNLIINAEVAEEEGAVSCTIINMKMAEKIQNLSINSDCHLYL